ncbi:hypothetical protein, partial [Lunatimonas lonarensis]|uniref:hypothetical protein n=1 Tax=Lunatimonas lonarensis TaxID=1232681 RepID=UPI001EE24576
DLRGSKNPKGQIEKKDPEGGRTSITPGASPGVRNHDPSLFWPAVETILQTPYRQNPWMPGGSGSEARHRFVDSFFVEPLDREKITSNFSHLTSHISLVLSNRRTVEP